MMINRQSKKTLASRQHHYITIQTKTKVSDGEGGFDVTWTDGDEVPAAIFPIRADQKFEYDSINVHATHRIEIRGLITVSEDTNRFRFGSRYFEILTSENLQERNVVNVITCKEIRA